MTSWSLLIKIKLRVGRRARKMVSYDTNFRIGEILKGIEQVKGRVDKLMEVVKPEEDLWDNSDIVRHWKVSERTLASWRSKSLITYIQVSGKIWYTRYARDKFLEDHLMGVHHKTKGSSNGK
jgi:hypothetical protein